MGWEDIDYSYTAPAEESAPYVVERGFFGGVTSGVLRGLADAASTTAAGLEEAGIDTPLREGIESAKKKFDILKPDVKEVFTDSIYEDIKRLPQQIVSSVATPLMGGVAGAAVGGAPGAAVGAAGAMITQFGLGTKREKTEEYLLKNPGDYAGAEAYGTIHGMAELGFEAASNAFAAVTFGGSKFISAVAKNGTKSTARELLSFSAGQLGKDTLKIGGVEMGSEMATYFTQSAADVEYGMGEGVTGEGLRSTAVTTAGMSLVFAAVGAKYQHSQRKQLLNMLEEGTESEQVAASKLISKELEKSGDTDLASAWSSYSTSRIDRGLPIKLDEDFIQLGNKVAQEKTMPGDILSSNPDVQKAAVDQILERYGIGEDGGQVQGPETFDEYLDQFFPNEEAITEQEWRTEEGRARATTRDANVKGKVKLGDILGKNTLGILDEEVDSATPEEIASFGFRTPSTPRQPSMTPEEIQAQEIATEEMKGNLTLERQWKEQEVKAKAYNQSRNEVIGQQMAREMDDKIRAEKSAQINALIDAAMPASQLTNDVVKATAEEQQVSEDEARAILHTNLSNYRKTVADYMTPADLEAMAKLRGSTNTVIRTMMQEVKPDSNDLAPVIQKAEEVASTSIKGSKQQTEAKEVVKAAKKVQAAKVKADKVVAKQEKVTEAIVSAPEPAPIATPAPEAKVQQTGVQTPSSGYTLEDTEKAAPETVASMENVKGVELAQMETPEDELMRKEATEATMAERVAKEEAMEQAESEIPALNEIANKSGDPLLTSLLNKNEVGLKNALKDKVTNSEKQAAILTSLKRLGEATVRKYASTIQPLISWAMSSVTTQNTKNVKGAKASDAIAWPVSETGSKATFETGTHKETGQKVTIEKIGDKRNDPWEIKVDGKTAGEAPSKTEARRMAEKFVKPLSPTKLAELKRASTNRSGKALSTEEKAIVENYKEATRKQEKTTTTKKEEVAPVTIIDPKTGERKVVEYKAPKKEVVEKLEKAEKRVRTKEEQEELDALLEENPDEEFDEYDRQMREEGIDPNEDVKVRKKVKEDIVEEEDAEGDVKLSPNLDKLLDKYNRNAQKVLDLIQERFGKGSRPEAEAALQTLIDRKNKTQAKIAEENKAEQERLEKIFTSGYAALDYVIENGTKMEKEVAKLIKANTPKWKIDLIKFKVDVNAEGASYQGGVVTLTTGVPRSALHEFIHAVTVEEIRANGAMKNRILKLMDKVKDHVLKEDILTAYQMDFINSVKTSEEFKKGSEGLFYDEQEKIAYALINEYEFLSMALSDMKVQEVLKGIKLENPVGTLKDLWHLLIAQIGKALGLSAMHYNALSDVLTITDKLLKQEERAKVPSTEKQFDIDGTFIDNELTKYTKAVPISETFKDKATSGYEKFENKVSDLFQSTYDNLAKISKALAEKLRVLDFERGQKITQRAQEVSPFEVKAKKLSDKDKKTLNFYLQNYNVNDEFRIRLSDFLRRKNMEKEFQRVIDMLKGIHQEFETFGLNKFDEVEFYYPRRIKDYDGLVRYLRKQEDWGVMDEALKKAEEEFEAANKGKKMTDSDRASVLAKMISTGRRPTAYLKLPASTKERTIRIVNAKMMEFYHDPLEALGMHISEATERIEINRMLGVTNRKQVIDQGRKLWKEMKRLKKEKNTEAFNRVSKEYADLVSKLPEMEEEIEGSIGDITAKLVANREITAEQQQRANNLIRARITEKGPGKIVSSMRSAFLLGSLTQMTTGVRQLSDVIWSIYLNGGLNTLQAAINVAGKKNLIKENFLDFQQPLKEFSRSTELVDKILKFSGLSLMDNLGKKISMEASQLKYKQMTSEEFQKKWEGVLTPDRIKQAHEDAKSGKVTNDIKYLVVSDIANYQPIFKSEMSKAQLQAGNARIFYFLKSYALKSAGAIYRESIGEIRKGNTKQGLKQLAQLGTLFIILGASADWLVDWLNGKDPQFTDSMIDTALTLSLMSQYSLKQGKKDGYVKAFVTQAIPPLNLIDLPTTDFVNLITGEEVSGKSIKLIPGLGAITYNRFSDSGQKSTINTIKENIYEDIRGGSLPSKDIQEVNRKIREYNIGKSKDKQIASITPGTISTIRKKEREKNAR